MSLLQAMAPPRTMGTRCRALIMDDLPLPKVPWAVGAVEVPQSPNTVTASSDAGVTLGRIVALAHALGISDGYDIALPGSPTGVYTVRTFLPTRKSSARFMSTPTAARFSKTFAMRITALSSQVVSYGTSLHMGRYFGLANQLICTAISLV